MKVFPIADRARQPRALRAIYAVNAHKLCFVARAALRPCTLKTRNRMMAIVWRRNGVKGAWVRAGLAACGVSAIAVWLYAAFDLVIRYGFRALLPWELPTAVASCALVLHNRRLREWRARQCAASNAAAQAVSAPGAQLTLPGLEDEAGADGPYPSCSLEEREYG
jgi:hypothetical protein